MYSQYRGVPKTSMCLLFAIRESCVWKRVSLGDRQIRNDAGFSFGVIFYSNICNNDLNGMKLSSSDA